MDDYTKVMDQYFKICLTTDSEIEDTPQPPLSTEVSAIAQKNLLPLPILLKKRSSLKQIQRQPSYRNKKKK